MEAAQLQAHNSDRKRKQESLYYGIAKNELSHTGTRVSDIAAAYIIPANTARFPRAREL